MVKAVAGEAIELSVNMITLTRVRASRIEQGRSHHANGGRCVVPLMTRDDRRARDPGAADGVSNRCAPLESAGRRGAGAAPWPSTAPPSVSLTTSYVVYV